MLDPFSGGAVRGIISAYLGRTYTGVDIRREQCEANEEEWAARQCQEDFFGQPMKDPRWITGDSAEIKELAKGTYDFLFSCPPYADLEVYSDLDGDISRMEYPAFLTTYRKIIKDSVAMLTDNAFACFVVGEIRDKKGNYRNFIGDTIRAFEDAGMHYYNEIILITQAGTAGIRARGQFTSTRKVVNTHQKALVFLKEKTPQAFDEMIDAFDRTRATVEMKQSALVFLKGDPKQAKGETEGMAYDFPFF